MSDVLLDVRGLRKEFRLADEHGHDVLVAVDDVSFTLTSGGSLAIVGESGSGKTTTARIVAGLESATAGSVTFDGADLLGAGAKRRPRRRRDIQMVFQDPFGSLDPRQSVGDCLREILKLHTGLTSTQLRERVMQLLAEVGLDESHANELPRGLSGGQRQRVAIARALAMNPRLLILDEPVSALDVSVQAQVLNLLTDLRERLDISYLFVSHDLAVVRQITDDCVVLELGRVVESGHTSDVLDDPQAPYTRQLLNAVPRPGWRPRRR